MPRNNYLQTKDFLVTLESFSLEYDSKFEMLITVPQPKNLSKYYDEKNYISHQDEGHTFISKIYQLVKKYTINKKVKNLSNYELQSKTLLDIGCGTGEFIHEATKQNWTTSGIEPGELARTKAQKKGLTVYENLENLSNKKYNIITLWHVLEHLPNLEKQISKIVGLLEKQGTLIIAVPNYKSYDAHYYKEYWAAYDTPRHLWHFSQQSISKLFSNLGLKIIDTKPMYFDSYYVSLLSEKYKNGKVNYLKAFYHGFLSNYKAKTTGEYSSLIYTLKRV